MDSKSDDHRTGLLVRTGAGLICLLYVLVGSPGAPLLPFYKPGDILFLLVSMCFPGVIGGAVSGFLIEYGARGYVRNVRVVACGCAGGSFLVDFMHSQIWLGWVVILVG